MRVRIPTLSGNTEAWEPVPLFGVAPGFDDTDSHASAWPLKLEIRTLMLRCGPSG